MRKAVFCRERFPDEEGIKTPANGPCRPGLGRERFPDEEGIKTAFFTVFALTAVARDSLMKKGLRHPLSRFSPTLPVARDSLMKKGLRQIDWRSARLLPVARDSLMKKGLRLIRRAAFGTKRVSREIP